MPELPPWLPLDQLEAAVSPGEGEGRVVGIVASRAALEAGWASGAAFALADRWASDGRRVVLADGGLEHPVLHQAAGLANSEGLTDAALYGVSVGKVARPVEGRSFFLVTAGTAVADPSAVVAHRRWGQLAQGFVDAGVTLGVFLPDGARGTREFLDSVAEVVVLAGPEEEPPESVRELEPLVSLHTGRGVAVGVAEAQPPAAARVGRGLGRWALVVLLLVLVAVAVAAAFGIITVPGITPGAGVSAPDASLAASPALR